MNKILFSRKNSLQLTQKKMCPKKNRGWNSHFGVKLKKKTNFGKFLYFSLPIKIRFIHEFVQEWTKFYSPEKKLLQLSPVLKMHYKKMWTKKISTKYPLWREIEKKKNKFCCLFLDFRFHIKIKTKGTIEFALLQLLRLQRCCSGAVASKCMLQPTSVWQSLGELFCQRILSLKCHTANKHVPWS